MRLSPDLINELNYPSQLPIVAQKEVVVQAIRRNQVIIVAGETGSGKSTQIPKMCLEAGRGRKGMIGCTQPRRIAATSLAGRVAEEMGGRCGELVGYKIRFKDEVGKATRIKFMTDGVLLAETQRDNLLRRYDTIIVDEAHERSLNVDFLLGLLRGLLERRPDLKVIITSATLDTEKFTHHFSSAPLIEVPGRTYPVELMYRADDTEAEGGEEAGHVEQAVDAVLTIRRQDRSGDMLIFMPTERDITETCTLLAKRLQDRGPAGGLPVSQGMLPLILPLFGRLARGDQQRIFQPAKQQKIVVATNIAETSLTVPGIRYVIDSGLARLTMYNPRARTTKMPVMPISKASADQRMGRCGRVGPGVCIRLYSEEAYEARAQFTTPEILRSNLAEVILRMLSLRLGDPREFPFIDKPSARAIRDGYALLRELGAIDADDKLSKRGKIMARLPLDPQIARMILQAREENGLAEVLVIAAALTVQEPRIRPTGKETQADAAHSMFVEPSSDFITLLNIWNVYQQTLKQTGSKSRVRKFCRASFLSFQRMREWEDIHRQIVGILAGEKGFVLNSRPAAADAIHRSILSGTLRSIGLKKARNIYQGGQDQELMVFPGSVQFNRAGRWIMAAELVETSRLYARTVAGINPDWIEPLAGPLCRSSYSSPHWEKKRGQVVALQKVTLFGLILVANRRVNFGPIDPLEARKIFIQSALVEGELRGSFAFLAHNKELLDRLREMEDRLRQRGILVDDADLYDFYDQRLPADVFDRAGLQRCLKRADGDSFLRLRDEDAILQLPDGAQLDEFPQHLMVGATELPLTYAFEPGSATDGVSVMIPAGRLAEIGQEAFEWLVPGLLKEKIVFLLKALPKSVRKQLVPLPDTASVLLREMTPGRGSLYRAMEKILASRYGVRVDPRCWTAVELPEHLRARFCLEDGDGKVVRTSKVFADLQGETKHDLIGGHRLEALREHWERSGITTWDFDGLPEKIPVLGRDGQSVGHLFPALVPDSQTSVAIVLCASPDEMRRRNCNGLAMLYSLQFRAQMKSARKDFSLKKLPWALCEGFGTLEDMDLELWALLLRETFTLGVGGAIPNREDFVKQVGEFKERGVYASLAEVMELVQEALRLRRQTLDLISSIEGKGRLQRGVEKFRCLVREILPGDFLSTFDRKRLASVPRYFRGAQIRLERAAVSPAKDAAKEMQVASYVDKLARCEEIDEPSEELARHIDQYREMIEEFHLCPGNSDPLSYFR